MRAGIRLPSIDVASIRSSRSADYTPYLASYLTQIRTLMCELVEYGVSRAPVLWTACLSG